MSAVTHTSFYNVTCKICGVIRDALVKGFESVIYIFEALGRAQAAHRLMAMGYTEEAKALMLGDKKDV